MITILELEGADDAARYIQAVAQGMPRELARALRRAGEHGVERLSLAAPRSSEATSLGDHLADSFSAEAITYGDAVAIDIHTSMPQRLNWVLDGTMAHVITARPGGVLAFESGGQTVFARSVLHPGTRPNDFVSRVLDVITEEANAEVDAAIARALSGAG